MFNRKEPSGKKGNTLNISNDKVFDLVKRRAYDLYCKRGYKHGHDMNDWVEAERQVRKELGIGR